MGQNDKQSIVFMEHLKYERRLSIHTLKAYETDLQQFELFLKEVYEQESSSQADALQIRAWIVELLSKNISANSIHRKLATLKAYFKYLKLQGVVEDSPMVKVIAPRKGKRLPTFIPEERLEQLFDAIHFSEDYTSQRNRLILEILYCTGIRRSELIGLNLMDIDYGSRVIKVRGKGGKERLIPFSAQLERQLLAFVELRQSTFPEVAIASLLLTDKGKTMYPKLVYNIVRKYLSKITTAEQRSPHVLRHSFATHLSNNGAELNAIKELLGHANLSATQVYTHNTIEKLKNAYKLAHPKASKP